MAMDHVFDLELALTMQDVNISGTEIKSSASDSEDEEEISATSTNTTNINISMKMMIPAAGGGTAVCTVCMEGFTGAAAAGGKQLVSCGHVYHENCITKWLSLHNSCPICRSSIYSGARNTTTLATHVIN